MDFLALNDFCKILKLQYDAKENDDFKNAKIFKIYEDLSNTRDVLYLGSTCDTLNKCMSNLRIQSKSRVNRSLINFTSSSFGAKKFMINHVLKYSSSTAIQYLHNIYKRQVFKPFSK